MNKIQEQKALSINNVELCEKIRRTIFVFIVLFTISIGCSAAEIKQTDSQQDEFVQQLKSIVQEYEAHLPDTTWSSTTEEFKKLLIKLQNSNKEGEFWKFDFWTGRSNFYLSTMKLVEVFDVTDYWGHANVLCSGEDSDGEKVNVFVTLGLRYENGNWLVDSLYNLKHMLEEFLYRGVKIPSEEGVLRFGKIDDIINQTAE